MLFQSKISLENLIIGYLAQYSNKSAHEIFEHLKMAKHPYTLQGVYKELKKLDREGVILKVDKKHSLRLSWALEYTALARSIEESYLSPQYVALLPKANKKEIWRFDNLFKLNDLWAQLLLVLAEQSKDKIICGWNPHTWFHLAEAKEEEKYIQSLERLGVKLYLFIGGNHYLDVWAEKYLKKEHINYSYAKTSFQEERSKYYNVVDDYILTVKLDQDTTDRIEALYEKTLSQEEMNIAEIMSIFNRKVKASLWLERDPSKAELYRKRFAREFGI